MAWKRSKKSGFGTSYGNARFRGRKKPKYSATEKFAFQLARVEKGLKNSNSRVAAAYNKGVETTVAAPKKPLF